MTVAVPTTSASARRFRWWPDARSAAIAWSRLRHGGLPPEWETPLGAADQLYSEGVEVLVLALWGLGREPPCRSTPEGGGLMPGRAIGARPLDRSSRLCESCGVRLTIGEPKATDYWPQRLALTKPQVDLLLQAAAEYRDLCDEAGEYEEAIAFVDWVAPDAMRNAA